ncbi:MAG: putative cytokinetic ring protein SteA [Actinomycetes bacterium]
MNTESGVEVRVTGPARADRRTKDLAKRLRPGEIAVIDHTDIDRVAAESLIAAGIAAVVNAGHSISGRYPNVGPIRLLRAGIPIIDRVEPSIVGSVEEGETLRLSGGEVFRGPERIAVGVVLTVEGVEDDMEAARVSIGEELQRFAENTLEYIRREADLTFEPVTLPPLRVDMKGRHALVVVRGHDYRDDLHALKAYIKEYRPVLIAVDGGADALLDEGFTPDVIIGDFDSVSEQALGVGADLVHHVHRDGRAPGRENLELWGVPYHEFVVDGTSEDVAMLLAFEAGATLIVAVGTHSTMVEFLDKGRPGMSSTFLTRLRLGPVLVDAKGVNRLYEGRVRRRDLLLLVASALVAMVAVSIVSEPIHVFLRGITLSFRDLWYSVFGAL